MLLRVALAALLGIAAAALIACGSTGKGLIPAASGGPLKSDIEAVDLTAQEGNGNCAATEAALLKTDQDFASLPSTIDTGLRNNLRQGISNLRSVALSLCTQPLAKTNTTTQTQTTTSTPTTSTPTTSTPTTSTPAEKTETPETEETPGPGGGTPAPGEGQGKPPGEGAGGAAPEEGENGAGGLEGGK
jgi:hypothetical protein